MRNVEARVDEHAVGAREALAEHERGRVALIGDAAHAGLPMMGQGGCPAMEDAWVLAELMASTHEVDEALDRFVDASLRERCRPRLGAP